MGRFDWAKNEEMNKRALWAEFYEAQKYGLELGNFQRAQISDYFLNVCKFEIEI